MSAIGNDIPATPPPAEPVVATPPPASPWSADLETYFGSNAEAIAAADRYQREKIQPYITSLESGSADARELWNDLNSDPATAARDIIASVYRENPDVVAAYDAIFAAEQAATPPPVEPAADEIPEWAKPLVEDRQARLDRETSETEAANYAAFKDGLKASHGLTDDDIGLIDPFIYGSPNDPDKAVAAYNGWKNSFLAKHGVEPAPTPAVPTPPPVLGSDGVSATPPLATQYTKYGQMGDALKGFFAREAASSTPPPVVG